MRRAARQFAACALLALGLSLPSVAQDEDEPEPRPPVPVELQSKINSAIDLGVESLLAQQSLDGSWSQQIEGYGPGMTGLALYALMKSGVSTEHPAIQRGFAFLGRHAATKTYTRACVLLAVATRGDSEDRQWVDELVEALVDSQTQRGWGYPHGAPDLSNTQFAAMALRAAESVGARVPPKAWTRLADAALLYLESETGGPKSGSAPLGFGYRPNGADATGSMTSAGVAILSMSLDRMRGRKSAHVEAFKRGRAWLGEHFSVDKNPAPTRKNGSHGHHHYYLYGLERVGSLLGVEHLGAHPWYLLGATKLVGMQTPDGGWGGQSSTAFALLFLARATGSLGPASGGGGAMSAPNWTFGEDDPAADVSLRASGRRKTTLWISSFGDKARELHASGDEQRGPLPIVSVEYWMAASGPASEPTLLERVAVTDAEESARKRYAVRLDLGGPLTCNVFARAYLEGQEAPLESKPLRIRVGVTERESWEEYATDFERNLFPERRVEATASSERDGARGRAANVVDGFVALGWRPVAQEEDPWVRVEVDRILNVNTILLSHGAHSGTLFDRFELTINDSSKNVISGSMVQDVREKTIVTLPKTARFRSLQVRFLGVAANNAAGIGEIEVQRRR